MLYNTDFSAWTGSMPNNWNKKNNSVLSKDTLVISKETNAVNIVTTSPNVGIEQSFTCEAETNIKCNLKNITGRSFINLAKIDDTSPNFNIKKYPNYSFTNVSCLTYIRLNNGKMATISTLTNEDETSSNSGYVYIQVENENPRVIKVESGVQQLMSTFIQYENKEIIIYHKIQNGKTIVSMFESTDSFNTVSRSCDILTYTEDMQSYSVIKCKNGKTIMPYLRATNNVYYLDILVSEDDLNTWTTLNQFKVVSKRGLMETKAVEISDNKVALFSRTELGYLAKHILDLNTMILSDYTLTDIATSSTAFSIKRVNADKIAIAWNSGNIDLGGGNYPRMNICLGFLSNDLNELDNISIIATNYTYGLSTNTTLPYIHSPIICLDNNDRDKIMITYEVVFSGTQVFSYMAEGYISKLLNLKNTAMKKGNNDVTINIPVGNYKVQFLSAIDKNSSFKIENIVVKEDLLLLKIENNLIRIPTIKIDNDYECLHIYNNGLKQGLSILETQNILGVMNNNYKYELKINIDGIERTLLCIT